MGSECKPQVVTNKGMTIDFVCSLFLGFSVCSPLIFWKAKWGLKRQKLTSMRMDGLLRV